MKARAVAIQVAHDVLNGKSLDDAFDCHIKKARLQDAAFIKELCYGVCRHLFYLNAIINHLSQKEIQDKRVRCACLIGFYQLLYSNIPAHAATSETINALGELNIVWAKAFVNALLRRFLREKNEILVVVEQKPEAKFSHPNWLIEKVKNQWPDCWESILTANNQRPVMTLRVNRQKISRNAYVEQLNRVNIECSIIDPCSDAILLAKPVAIDQLPGFETGWVSVQDLGAQKCVELMTLKPNSSVLDACAAPGGKAAHLLEREPTVDLTAVEKSPNRFKRLQNTFSRLQLTPKMVQADVTHTESWWDGNPFDVIVVDAPCSGTGVIKRHPDIKLLRRKTDIAQFAEQQLTLLMALWPLLKKNGHMIYLTCSILAEENESVIGRFLAHEKQIAIEPIATDFGISRPYGQQLLPTQINDGFYAAILKKTS